MWSAVISLYLLSCSTFASLPEMLMVPLPLSSNIDIINSTAISQ